MHARNSDATAAAAAVATAERSTLNISISVKCVFRACVYYAYMQSGIYLLRRSASVLAAIANQTNALCG